MRSIHNSLPINLLRLRDRFMVYFRPIIKEYGLTEQQWRIIRSLYEYPDSAIERIGHMSCISAPSLTGILNRMEKNDWIVRRIDTEDRRRTYVKLSPTGEELYRKVTEDSDQAYKKLEADVGHAEIKILEGIIESIQNKLSK